MFQKVVLTNFFLKTRLLRAIELVRVLGMYIRNIFTIFKEHKDLNKIIKGFQDENIITKSKVSNQKKKILIFQNLTLFHVSNHTHQNKDEEKKRQEIEKDYALFSLLDFSWIVNALSIFKVFKIIKTLKKVITLKEARNKRITNKEFRK